MPTKPAELVIPADLAKAFEVKDLPVKPDLGPGMAVADAPPAKTKRARKARKGRKSDEVQGIGGPGSAGFAIPSRRPEVEPIWVGERVWMDVTWLSTKAGEFLLEVLPFKVMNDRKVYDLKGSARTSELFSLIYKAEDWVESFVDFEGWFPYKFVLHGDETKHVRNNLELFDHGAKKQYVHVHDNRIQKNEIHEEKGFKDLVPLSQDSLSALYYVRTQKLADGAVIRFPMTTNGSQWETVVTVLGREEVNTKMGFLKSFKTKIETRFNGVLQQQGDAFMWFSDDERKYPLRFEAKVRIGWVAGIARKIEPGTPEQPASLPSEKKTRAGGVATAVGPTGRDTPGSAPAHSVKRSGVKRRLWFHNLIESTK